MKKLTPAMQQYMDLKKQHNDCLMFFRLGDFYELFYEDAKIAHKILGITLTAKNKKSDNPIPMAGIPYHALDRYLPRLVKAGHKVAMAEQVGKVVPGKVVDRQVVQIITPGTYIDENNPDARYICAVSFRSGDHGSYQLSWGDYSLGDYYTSSFESLELLTKKIAQINPAEIVIDIDTPEKKSLEDRVYGIYSIPVTIGGLPYDEKQYIQSQLNVSTLDGYGLALDKSRQGVFSLLIQYIHHTQKRSYITLASLRYVQHNFGMQLDDITIKNLEIFSSSYEGATKQSLYGVMNSARTAMGSRLLAKRLSQPLNNKTAITARQTHIGYCFDRQDRTELLTNLSGIPDIPRLLTTMLWRKPSAIKVQNLSMVLHRILDNTSLIELLKQMSLLDENTEQSLQGLMSYIDTYIQMDHISDEGGYIIDGADAEIDRLRYLVKNSDDLMIAYQQELVTHSGVTRIKIKYVNNQGYVIEVTPTDIDKFESTFSELDNKYDLYRQQTLKSGQRYMSTHLDDMQKELLASSDLLKSMEFELLTEIIARVEVDSDAIYMFADAVAYIDLVMSHADFAQSHSRVKPEMLSTYDIHIVGGRHPVVEHYLPHTQSFIPNDLIQSDDDYFQLITGPNMGGKSTFLRQHALIVLLAHAGLCVPASTARIGLVDGIFARVGSGDALAKNQSTFMTEMIEMSNILHNATSKSFVVLDELGRGTSTYDGLALAKSIVTHMCTQIGCKTLFATHYHELTSLSTSVGGFSNWSVSVYETDQDIVFMKKIVKGGASKSYGLDVAKLAGVPKNIVDTARKYLSELESKKTSAIIQTGFRGEEVGSLGSLTDEQKTNLELYEKLKEKLSHINISHMTPVQALVELEKIMKTFV